MISDNASYALNLSMLRLALLFSNSILSND
ncbi:hypothetical protein SMG44B_10045 [Stenotrophomonas maltophilia]